uniref:Uncharacterized protein n=1 Tax=Oryza barthii TaxID=65489 RepID=A0A0D3GGB7_9ORYZ
MWLYGEGRPTACSSTASDVPPYISVRWAAGGQWRSGRSAASAAEAEHTRAAGGGGGGGGLRWATGGQWRRRIENCATRRCGKRLQGGHEGVTREEDVAATPSILPETGGIMHLVPNLRRFGLGVAELERLNCGGDPLHDLNAAMAALESSASAAAAVRASSVDAAGVSWGQAMDKFKVGDLSSEDPITRPSNLFQKSYI